MSVPYFLDSMKLHELELLASSLEYTDRPIWDCARLICFVSAQKASKKKLKLSDLFALPWDNDDYTERELMQQFEQQQQLAATLNS